MIKRILNADFDRLGNGKDLFEADNFHVAVYDRGVVVLSVWKYIKGDFGGEFLGDSAERFLINSELLKLSGAEIASIINFSYWFSKDSSSSDFAQSVNDTIATHIRGKN